MKDEDPQEAPPVAGKFASAVLRAVDAAIGALQRLRKRIEAPAEDEEAAHAGGTGAPGLDEAEPAGIAEPRPKTLRRRLLTVVMCILLGFVAGAWLAYRSFSRQLVSHEKLVERMRDDIQDSRKAETVSLKARDKCFDELAAYRQQAREAKEEIADCRSQAESLSQQVAGIQRPARPAARPAAAATNRPRAVEKSGTCATGGRDPAGSLLDCIEKFNRQ